jgi:hypothetical protein
VFVFVGELRVLCLCGVFSWALGVLTKNSSWAWRPLVFP